MHAYHVHEGKCPIQQSPQSPPQQQEEEEQQQQQSQGQIEVVR
jgi:hypothetical protein